jgi:hypothetical protein
MTYKGGSEAKGGFYWKRGDWEIVTVDGAKGKLPGPSEADYVRIPGPLLLPVALVVSIAYVVFLPLVGFAMLFRAAAGKTGGRIRKGLAKRLPKKATSAGEGRQAEAAGTGGKGIL